MSQDPKMKKQLPNNTSFAKTVITNKTINNIINERKNKNMSDSEKAEGKDMSENSKKMISSRSLKSDKKSNKTNLTSKTKKNSAYLRYKTQQSKLAKEERLEL